ncbi:erythronate-4-phosphate dehydrogenase domain-containing protein [Besnoitia besnoiti]|uniref:Erythronate-4-phosphate dehydrogenase domain-containing protein n=1 Tax=Besnoitia besnoiti TaxID=94643 RepID=A0A2A9MGN8_BESBE|nr:erythronate-4-phosphate dehydrogenase domain-containing protein [Besnoitia besnoiti]PFH37079.1 erythronate-4-phosphate dehydrogenase domain-containing protein [Besnoitia besnoiti]
MAVSHASSAAPLSLAVLLKEEVPRDTPCTLEAPESISRVVFPRFLEFLRAKYPTQTFNILTAWSPESAAQQAEKLKDVSVVFIIDTDPAVFAAVYEHATNLRWVHIHSVGVDRFAPFLLAAKSHRNPAKTLAEDPAFLVTNGKGVFTPALAEYVATALLYFAKDVRRLEKLKKENAWEPFPMSQLRGKTVGFLGFGEIARETAKLLQAFGMRCTALKRTASEKDALAERIWTSADPDGIEFFRSADYIVCSLPATPETTHAVGRKEFAAMKPSAVFISIGRGSVVDEAALLEALKNKTIAAAALDVFHTEPLPATSPLWAAENLLISSHCCDWVKDHSASDAFRVFDENFSRFQQGAQRQENMYTPINKALGY